MKPLIVAGNWKLQKTEAEAIAFVKTWWPLVSGSKNKLMLFPSAILLSAFGRTLKEVGGEEVDFGPQNIWCEAKGAFTGENSVEQATSVGATSVLLGHSERRQSFGETDASVNKKLKLSLNAGLKSVLCVGETLAEREAGTTNTVVTQQLEGALAGITDLKNLIVAYEPVWAIGTGKVATPEQAEAVHAHITAWFAKKFNGSKMQILYGGSVKSDSAATLAIQKNIHGFLVGGASLDPAEFAKICNT